LIQQFRFKRFAQNGLVLQVGQKIDLRVNRS